MQYYFITDKEKAFMYDGTQLRSHFIREKTGLAGDAIIAWQGPCRVPTEHLVDLEDVENNDFITSAVMLHFIGEFFHRSTYETNLWLRILVSIAHQELLKEWSEKRNKHCDECLFRDGDDLMVTGEPFLKLSVGIATTSTISGLLHFGINIDCTGAPVPATDLLHLGIVEEEDTIDFAHGVMAQFLDEWVSHEKAIRKVRPVP